LFITRAFGPRAAEGRLKTQYSLVFVVRFRRSNVDHFLHAIAFGGHQFVFVTELAELVGFSVDFANDWAVEIDTVFACADFAE
jgi:hypothetical protein